VLSVHVRTDPRDPVNTAATPKWLVELRNGLRQVAAAANGGITQPAAGAEGAVCPGRT
jgi:hypothetical protein